MTRAPAHRARRWLVLALAACFVLTASSTATAEQASSDLRRAHAAYLDVGDEHSCAILTDNTLRCWGNSGSGRLGYGTTANIMSAGGGGPLRPGGRAPRSVVASVYHTCAIVDDGSVRCWGFGANGRLGYGNTADVRSAAEAPPVDLGPGRTATAIAAGASHTCAILDTGQVKCWGNGVAGRLGYGNQVNIGDDETPAAVGVVDIGAGRTAVAITAGAFHTCAIRDDGALMCWGFDGAGQLGYATRSDVGDNETPASVGPVPLNGRAVRAVSGGKGHTCAILDDGSARCWGFGADGRLGYGGTADVQGAATAGVVSLGPGRSAIAIAAGEAHSCAILDTGVVRCWGFGGSGRLGYGNADSIGDDPAEAPSSAGPIGFGFGRTARAISPGYAHTCALLDNGTVSCWGSGGSGRLGYGDNQNVGETATRTVQTAGAIPLGGVVPPTIADLRLAISTSVPQLGVGTSAPVAVQVTNVGPEASDGVSVAVPAPPGLAHLSAAPSQGSFSGGSGSWNVGTLAPGATAVLNLSVGATAPGAHILAAEVAGAAVFDPTSTPSNGAAEDDRGAVTLIATTLAGGPGPTARLRPLKLGVKVVRFPKKGRATRLTVSGALTLPRSRPAPRCSGRVRVLAKAGKRTVAQKTVSLRRVKGVCRYTTVLRPTRAKVKSATALAVTARFLGTPTLQPRASRALKVRVR